MDRKSETKLYPTSNDEDACSSTLGQENISPSAKHTINNKKKKIRHSLPGRMSRSFLTKSFKKNAKKHQLNNSNDAANQSNNSNTIYEDEIKEFEKNHCNNNNNTRVDQNTTYSINSPPGKFFRVNSNPYRPSSPKKCNELLQQRASSYAYAARRQNVAQKTDSGSSGVSSGNYENFDLNLNSSSSIDDAASLLLRRSRRSSSQRGRTQIMKAADSMNLYKRPQLYECDFNKHGDLVEYALPYDQPMPSRSYISSSETSYAESNRLTNTETVIDDNFDFLNDTKNRSINLVTDEDKANRSQIVRRHTITDLDKSYDLDSNKKNTGSDVPKINNEICSELLSLEHWSMRQPQIADKSLNFMLAQVSIGI